MCMRQIGAMTDNLHTEQTGDPYSVTGREQGMTRCVMRRHACRVLEATSHFLLCPIAGFLAHRPRVEPGGVPNPEEAASTPTVNDYGRPSEARPHPLGLVTQAARAQRVERHPSVLTHPAHDYCFLPFT